MNLAATLPSNPISGAWKPSPLLAEHASAIAAIELEASATPWSLTAIADSLRQSPTVAGLGVWHNGQLLGHLLWQSALGEWEVLCIAVHPAWQRQGIGRRLLESLRLRAKAAQCEKIYLEVAKRNVAAQQLYRQAGFVVIAERKNYYRLPVLPQHHNHDPSGNPAQFDNALIMSHLLK